jgi:L-malate glycosyltransferase
LSLFQIDTGRECRGGQRPSFLLARELRDQGYPVHLVVQSDSPLHEKAAAEGLPLLPIKMKGEAEVGAGYKLSKAMRKHGCVLAHFHAGRAIAVGGAACTRAKVLIRAVSRRLDLPLRRSDFAKQRSFQDLDLVIAGSEDFRDVLIRNHVACDKIEVIPPGLDFSAFEGGGEKDFLRREFSFRPDDFLVGITAFLEDEKGHRYLIEAARILRERTPKIKIIIVGQGALELGADKQARDLGLGDLVFYLGFRQDVPRVLYSLDCFVLSSELDGSRDLVLGAMASRLPVVATQVGDIPEVVLHDETGYLVSPRNPRALAEAIYSIFKDPELAKRFGERGRETIDERFSSLAMARKTIALYKRIAYRKRVNLGL